MYLLVFFFLCILWFYLFRLGLAAVGESFSQQINSREMSPCCSPAPLLRPQQQDRDWVVPSRLATLKYVHALPCTTQCDSVKEQSRACGAGIFFVYDQQSGWTWPPDKDAVCGMMLVWCPPAWPVGRGWCLRWYIYTLATSTHTGQHRGIPGCLDAKCHRWWCWYSSVNLHRNLQSNLKATEYLYQRTACWYICEISHLITY